MTPTANIKTKVQTLDGLDLVALRIVWAANFGSPPKLRSTDLLRLMLAWRL